MFFLKLFDHRFSIDFVSIFIPILRPFWGSKLIKNCDQTCIKFKHVFWHHFWCLFISFEYEKPWKNLGFFYVFSWFWHVGFARLLFKISSKNDQFLDQKMIRKHFKMSLKILIILRSIFHQFWDAFGGHFGTILGPKIGPKMVPKWSQHRIGQDFRFLIDFGPILDPF